MQIKTSSGVHYVNANYVVEEKQGEYPKLTCTIAKKDNHWLDEVQELDRVYTEGEQDEFVIVNPVKITKGDSYDLEISAVGAFHFEFVKSYMYNELKTATYHIDYLLGKLFEGSRFVLELNGTFPTVEFEGFGKDDKLTLFERVMSRFGAEYKIVGKVVQVNNKIGNDTGFQFRYLKNIKDTEYSIDASEIATYAKGLGAWKDEEDHSKGRLEIEYKSSLYDIFGHLDYGTVEDERMYYADTLKAKCKSVLDATVSVTLKTTLVALQRQSYKAEAHIGDFIWFIDERIQLEKKIRFAQIKTTYLSDDSILKQEVVLGDKDAYSKQKDNETQSSAVVKQTSNQLSELAQKVDKTHVLAQNGVKIYFSDVMPVDEPKGTIRKGDKLYLDKNGKVLMYYWNGVQWELEPVVNDVEKFKQEIAKDFEEVDAQLAAQSDAHNQAVAEILAQATSAEDLAAEAKRIGEQAVADAISLTTQLNTAKSSLQNQINKAKSDLQASVATVDAKAEQAQADVNQARKDLQSQANQLSAQATKQEELTKLTTETKKLVDGQITTINELSKTVAQNGKDIASVQSRTKTVEETLSGTKTTLEQVKATAESTSRKTAEIESGIDGLNSKFENLQIGSTNLLRNTATLPIGNRTKGEWEITAGGNGTAQIFDLTDSPSPLISKAVRIVNNTSGNKDISQFVTLKVGENYTISAWARVAETSEIDNPILLIRAWDTNDTNKRLSVRITNTDWQRYSVTFVAEAEATAIEFGQTNNGNIEICGPQIEQATVRSDYKPSELDLSQTLATYQQSAERNLADLQSTIQTLDSRVTSNKSSYDQDASKIATRLSSLETYKNAEGTRESKYFEAAKAETAKQLAAERTAIARDYVAKSTYTSDVTGIRNDLTATTTTVNTTKINLANYQTSNDKAVANLKSSLQTADGKISGLQTSLNAVPGQISAAVSAVETKIPTSIGGRNYIKNYGTIFNPSNLHTSSWKFETVDDPDAKSGKTVKATCTAAGSNGFHKVLYDLRGDSFDGRQMTYAVDIKVSKAVKLRMGAEIFQGGYKTFDATTSWQRFVHTGIVKLNKHYSFPVYIDSGSWSVGDVIWLRDPQLEDGSIATTAGPATEDIASDITQAKAEIKVNSDEIAKRLTRTEVQTVVTGYGYQTKAQVDSNITGRGYITSSALQPYATTTVLENKVKETAKEYTRLISETQALIPTSVGGTNLLLNGQFKDGLDNWQRNYASSGTFDTDNHSGANMKQSGLHFWGNESRVSWFGIQQSVRVNLNKGDRVTVSVSATSDGGEGGLNIGVHFKQNGEILAQSWKLFSRSEMIYRKYKRFYITFIVPNHVEYTDQLNFMFFGENGKTCNLYITDVKAAVSPIGSDYSPAISELTTVTAFNKVKDTVDEHKRMISAGGSISNAIQSATKFEKSIASGGDIYQAIQTAKGLVSTVSGANGLSNQVSQLAGSYAIKNLTSSGNMINQINLSKDGSIKFDGSLIRITGKTVIDNGVIKSAMIANGQIGTAQIGTIDASKANIINLNVKNVSADGFTGNVIKGGILRSTNSNTEFNLNDGKLIFNNNNTGVFRVQANASTMGLKFTNSNITVNSTSRVLSRVILGGDRRETSLDEGKWDQGGFSGVIIETINGADSNEHDKADSIRVVGDNIFFTHTYNDDKKTGLTAQGWKMETFNPYSSYAGYVVLKPYGISKNKSIIEAGDLVIANRDGSTYNTRGVIRRLMNCFQHFLNGGTSTDAKTAIKAELNYISKI